MEEERIRKQEQAKLKEAQQQISLAQSLKKQSLKA